MASSRARKRKKSAADDHVDERWLLTYADLITLLMALFLVMWAISTVSSTKFDSLKQSLAEAFNGKVITGGESIKESGGVHSVQTPNELVPMVERQESENDDSSSAASQARNLSEERERLKAVKRKIDMVALKRGVSGKIKTVIADDGLHVRIMTDDLLFDSGSAQLKPPAGPLLAGVGKVFAEEGRHAVIVSGHTDNVPISSRYASNWNLSSDRSANVVIALQKAGVKGGRLTARGRSSQEPIASNKTDLGRSLNRRVELLLPREVVMTSGSSGTSEEKNSIMPHFAPESQDR